MSRILVTAIDRDGVPPREISSRLRSQLNYFAGAPGPSGAPPLGENEYWFNPDEVARWVDEGVFSLVSPLDSAHKTEVELTEEQEDFLGWLLAAQVRHVRVVDQGSTS
jgi:hypothetical protein